MKQQDSQSNYWGIDISKSVFDVFHQGESYVFDNSLSGFKSFLKLLSDDSHCVMESTGPYYLRLAFFLFESGLAVSIINPLVIKRFSQMRMIRAKTDKADAQLIALYADIEVPSLWSPPSDMILGAQQMRSLIDHLKKQITMLGNHLSSLTVQPYQHPEVIKTLKRQLNSLKLDVEKLEERLLNDLKDSYQEEFKLLTSIPGIGTKTAASLLLTTQGFTKFASSRQLSSYAGLCPRIYQSGSSVRGRGHIVKMGGDKLRSALYIASWTASQFNGPCHTLYQRLLQKGKPKKLALIAVANKLIRQAFAVVNQKKVFDPEYYLGLNRNYT